MSTKDLALIASEETSSTIEHDTPAELLLAAGHLDDSSEISDSDEDPRDSQFLHNRPTLSQRKSAVFEEQIPESPFIGKKVTKAAIVTNWLPRYTGVPLEEFGEYILLCNFIKYVKLFAEMFDVPIYGETDNKPMQSATYNNITIINFGMGSAAAATVMDLLSAIQPKAVLFLGKCGGLKKSTKIGSYILPIAAIRGEGTSDDYFPPLVPALPSFALQKAVSTTLRDVGQCEYFTGSVFTTNRRIWEHDDHFKDKLKQCRAIAVDLETATLFIVGFANKIPTGALLLVSDQPMIQEGIKTAASDEVVTANFCKNHIKIGIESLKQIQNSGNTIKHLKF